MTWGTDPGGNFDTDVHRRVAAAFVSGGTLTLDDVWTCVQADDFLYITYDAMVGVLNELSAAGAVVFDQSGNAAITEAARGVFDGTNPNQVFVYRRQGGE